MSGGHFDYQEYSLLEMADKIDLLVEQIEKDRLAEDPDDIPAWHFSDATIDRFRQASETLRRAFEMVVCVDYLVSADDGEASFNERWESKIK